MRSVERMSVINRLAAAIVIAVCIAIFGFLAGGFIAFATGESYYFNLIAAVSAGLIVFTFLWLFNVKPKIVNALFVVCLAVAGTHLAVHEFKAYRTAHMAVVADSIADLDEYRPFAKGTKAVRLDQPASLKLDRPLPRLDGATALYPLYSAFVQAVYPEGEYELSGSAMTVTSSRTAYAYKRLLIGDTDIVFAAEPSEDLLEQAKRQGADLVLTPIGREAFVFFVNASNPVTDLSTAQIRDIYAGRIADWSEVGGRPGKIVAFQRDADSGSQTMLLKLMDGRPPMTPPRDEVLGGMGEIIGQTTDYRNFAGAIGFSFLFYATEMVREDRIRLLSVDGVTPSRATIAGGAYPLTESFYAVTDGPPDAQERKLIDWILSPEGQSLVERTGYTPIGPTRESHKNGTMDGAMEK